MTELRNILRVCVVVISLCVCVSFPAARSSLGSSVDVTPQPYDDSVEVGLQESGNHDREEVKVKVRRQALANRTRLWQRGIVPYLLDQAYSQEIRDLIEVAMREIEQSVGSEKQPCVQFVRRTSEINYLDVRLGNSCNSVIGLDYTGPQVSTFSVGCALKGSVLHELLHTLGLYHEQDRYDRDDFVNINVTNMREDAYRDFVVKNRTMIDTLGTPYDFTSIMQYGPYNAAKDLRYPVMTPKPQFSSGLWMGQRSSLSRLDVLRVQRLYGCQEDTSHILSDISEDNRLAWCDFGGGICNFSTTVTSTGGESGSDNGPVDQSATGQASKIFWTVTSKATPDGPVAGTTNGIDAFFYASKEYCELVAMDVPNQTMPSATAPEANNSSKKSMEIVTTASSLTNSPTETHSSAETVQETSNVTVSLITPMMSANSSACCIEFRIFQAGPSSHLDMYVSGPAIPRLLLGSLKGVLRNHWALVRQSLALPSGIQFRLDLTAMLDHGSVAIDNVHITKGVCR